MLKIGTRKTRLALIQTDLFMSALRGRFPALDAPTVCPYVTSGDIHQTERLADMGGKGLFAKKLDQALLEGDIDVAVHSLKDMETHLPEGIEIAGVLEREDPRDVFISREGLPLDQMPQGARIGTASMRRQSLLLNRRPDLQVDHIRGRVETRLEKVKTGEFEGTFLALAGLNRLGLEAEVTEILDPERFIPAAGQGVIAFCVRSDRTDLKHRIVQINHQDTWQCIQAERSLLAEVDGSCHTPIGAHATLQDGVITLRGFLGSGDGRQAAFKTLKSEDPQTLGQEVGCALLSCFS